MRKTALLRLAVTLLTIGLLGASASAQIWTPTWLSKLDPLLQSRASLLTGRSRVIVRTTDETSFRLLAPGLQLAGVAIGRSLPIVNGLVVDLPNVALAAIASSSSVLHVSLDRTVAGAMERTGATVGATAVRQDSGYDGTGIGVAIIDSGVTAWHDDLADPSGSGQRLDRFVDLVGDGTIPSDDYGHGTHVAGIIAGNGSDSSGKRTGIAPGAHLVVYKVLDGSGSGRISDVIAALDDIVAHKDSLNIRVVNLSVATGVYESYMLDPLTLAAQRAVAAGIVVVAAAGNYGRSPNGATRYGRITAPGNAPWVLTVGASSHMGTADRADDTIAPFSSRGPTAIDRAIKPDLVAPGVGIESLTDPLSSLYSSMSPYLLNGTIATSYKPYLSLSGTSMAAPVVSGTVALMLQANPNLTPNQVKAIVQYTAQMYVGYDRLTQGAGFLNAKDAVELAAYMRVLPTLPDESSYALAWFLDVVWPAASAPEGWAILTDGDISGATDGDTVVWGTSEGDTVVWGTSEGDTVVWGTSCSDPSCQPTIWDNP
jgi:serine protease AprX